MEPAPETRREAEAAEPALAKRVDRKGKALQEWRVRRILAEHFDVDADFRVRAGQLSDSFRRATICGRQATDDVEYPHSRRVQAVTV